MPVLAPDCSCACLPAVWLDMVRPLTLCRRCQKLALKVWQPCCTAGMTTHTTRSCPVCTRWTMTRRRAASAAYCHATTPTTSSATRCAHSLNEFRSMANARSTFLLRHQCMLKAVQTRRFGRILQRSHTYHIERDSVRSTAHLGAMHDSIPRHNNVSTAIQPVGTCSPRGSVALVSSCRGTTSTISNATRCEQKRLPD